MKYYIVYISGRPDNICNGIYNEYKKASVDVLVKVIQVEYYITYTTAFHLL